MSEVKYAEGDASISCTVVFRCNHCGRRNDHEKVLEFSELHNGVRVKCEHCDEISFVEFK